MSSPLERWRLAKERNVQAAEIILANPERFRPGSLLHRWAMETIRKATLEGRTWPANENLEVTHA